MTTPTIERRTPGPDSPEWAKACATLYDVFCEGWGEPVEVTEMREKQRAYLDGLTPEQYNEWLDEQAEEAGARYDAQYRTA